ncbi:hypothetical protein L9Z73_23190, partial [Pseudomonas sp. TNT11]|nr:hypothetical protein [Pseudomonas emilianonis]
MRSSPNTKGCGDHGPSRIASYPGIAPTLVVLVLLPLMVGLGFWQLSRGHEKQLMVDSYAERRA